MKNPIQKLIPAQKIPRPSITSTIQRTQELVTQEPQKITQEAIKEVFNPQTAQKKGSNKLTPGQKEYMEKRTRKMLNYLEEELRQLRERKKKEEEYKKQEEAQASQQAQTFEVKPPPEVSTKPKRGMGIFEFVRRKKGTHEMGGKPRV